MKVKRNLQGDFKKALLRALQDDAGKSNRELAHLLSIDPSSLSRTKYRYETDGSIKHYKAILNPKAFGQNTVAFLKIALINSDSPRFEAAIKYFSEQPEVQEIHSIEGEFDLFIKIRVPTNADVLAFGTKKATKKNNVQRTNTMLVFDTYKETLDIPI
jgi:Lrp/AsnC family leucine-responsive transcriptional regulator